MHQIYQANKKPLHKQDSDTLQSPIVLVDVVIFTILNNKLQTLIIKRSEEPFKNEWSLVGGFIDVNKDIDIDATAKRKLKEKTSVLTPYLEQYGSIGNAKRDPRGWSVTHIYFSLISNHKMCLQAGKNVSNIKWSEIKNDSIKEKLAFDHTEILKACIGRLRSKLLYTSLPVHLMPEHFTIRELQTAYEIILDHQLEHKAFRRRIFNANILEETGKVHYERGRPAALYRLKRNETHFFIRNIEGAK